MKKLLQFVMASLMLSLSCAFAESIYPISREMGSGTRGAFVDIFDVKQETGKKIDATSKKAEVTNSTGVMITTVANSKNAIGYISLGALNDEVKALKIDGVAPSVANINNKSYTIFRPFNVVTKTKTPLAEDFLSYASSQNALAIIEKAGYIAVSKNAFSSKKPKGKLVIAGSSSVTPLMEKLKEAYEKINPNANLEILQSDSTTGVTSTIEGIADIGMVSREVKQSELKKGLKAQVLALDGLAVIVHKSNKLDDISKESVKKIFMGEVTDWDEVR
ncbi:phosphate ABC transporter, periplasmic phosphate-binding protein [Candidatus Campylobacter infans]|uniref:Phosphate ABC transporter, periplasmic phosphate-binding protein n=1 Tax=Candidatus Campylobacter infans TaxID=2561898 RepID=A0A7H9CES5_9BACT|nr:substrate-binding domain-containing protein [Candidatus Campylobacter infans]QLI04700.1 phosphate ABC transporter, periplasmic phosphate-binding protein [Candidatus Campylobacter infans]